MIAASEPASIARYGALVLRSLTIRLIALVAVLMLPFAMAAAPAAPATAHHSSVAMPADHCEGEQSENPAGAVGHNCAMPCSSALPAFDLAPVEFEKLAEAAEPSLDRSPAGIFLEIATPPPKVS